MVDPNCVSNGKALTVIIFFMCSILAFGSCSGKEKTRSQDLGLLEESENPKKETVMDGKYISLGKSGYEAQLMPEYIWHRTSIDNWIIYNTRENKVFRYAIAVVSGESEVEMALVKALDLLDIDAPNVGNWEPNLANEPLGTIGSEHKFQFKQLTLNGCKIADDISCIVTFAVIHVDGLKDDPLRIIVASTKPTFSALDPLGAPFATIRPKAVEN